VLTQDTQTLRKGEAGHSDMEPGTSLVTSAGDSGCLPVSRTVTGQPCCGEVWPV
jgi:hypothetical protein